MGVKILVTGGAGFIGSNLVDHLISLGHEVSVLDNLSTGKIENVNKKANLYISSIEDKNIEKIFEKERFHIVYHMAAQIDVQKSIKDPVYDGDVNILGSINILDNCRKYEVKKIIYSSSAAVYGEPKYLGIDEKHSIKPISYYGLSKYVPEEYIRLYGCIYNLDYTILRYANVYGIRQDPKGEGGVISIFLEKLLRKESPIIFGDGSAKRDFIYVEDIVGANIKAMEKGNKETFNIGTGKYISIKDLAQIMIEKINPKEKEKYEKERKGDIQASYFNIDKAKNILEWHPNYGVEEGVEKTITYYKKDLFR